MSKKSTLSPAEKRAQHAARMRARRREDAEYRAKNSTLLRELRREEFARQPKPENRTMEEKRASLKLAKRAAKKRAVRMLNGVYIRKLLKAAGFRFHNIPESFVQAKRAHLQLVRFKKGVT